MPQQAIDSEPVKAALRNLPGEHSAVWRAFAAAIADRLPSPRMRPAALVLAALLVLADALQGIGPADLTGHSRVLYAQLRMALPDLARQVLPSEAAAVVKKMIEDDAHRPV